jgi:hypothetical protein
MLDTPLARRPLPAALEPVFAAGRGKEQDGIADAV